MHRKTDTPRGAPTIKGTEHRKEDSINKLSKIKAWKKYNLENPNEEDCNKNNIQGRIKLTNPISRY